MRECSIEGCEKKHKGHGFCVMHLHRFKKWGDPNFVLFEKASNGAVKAYYKNIFSMETDDCISWPFNKTAKGYPVYKRTDKSTDLAHRQVCEDFHGSPENEKLEAAHDCGNRLCVNPRHLRWATMKENHKDKIKHGTNGKKLALEQVEKIRKDKRLHKEIAKDFGIGVLAVHKIKAFKTWKNT